MGKRSVNPLNHFANYRESRQKELNVCPPLAVENLKGFQLQGALPPDLLTRGIGE